MDITFIKARDLPEAWWKCIRAALREGREYKIDKGSYAGQKRKELEFIIVQIEKPGTRPLVPDVPTGLPVPTDINYIMDYYTNYLMLPKTGLKPNEQYTYGDDISPQFLEACRKYKEEGFNTNQVCLSVGSRESIFLNDPQCLRLIDTRVLDGKLNYIVYFRSWDLFGGFPTNLAAIQLMKESMAQEIGVQDGEMIALSKGLHLYDHHWELGKEVVRG